MEKTKVKNPSILLDLQQCSDLVTLIKRCQEEDCVITQMHIQGEQLEDLHWRRIDFEKVVFENCTFKGIHFERTAFEHVIFKNCDFSESQFVSCWFTQCQFEQGSLKGVQFNRSHFYHVTLEQCDCKYTNFTASDLDRCWFEKSDLTDAFFAECRMQALGVDEVKFVRTEFFHTPLKGIDFSTCRLDGISLSEDRKELEGAIVNGEQAMRLARLLGVVIKDCGGMD